MCRKLICLIFSVFLPGLILSSTSNAAEPGLVGWWKFEEASGTLLDQSDNNNDGTPYNGVLYQQAGQVGYALGFDGTDDYIVVGTTGRPTDTFSFGGWFKTSVTHEIDSQETSGYGGVNNQRYAFDPQHGGDLNAGAGLSIGTNGVSVYEHGSDYMPATAVYEAELGDDWNHVMVVYDKKRPTIYLNGRAVVTGFSSPRAIVSAPIQFGGMAYGYFEGLMDEVRIYNRVLSPAEIKKLAARTKAWSPDPPDGAVYSDTWITLSWSPGDFAVSHDVYMGESFGDVDAGAGDTFRGNQTLLYYVAGFPGYAYPDGLVPGTTYYWRIDEVNDADPNSPWKGDVWSFSIPPKAAYFPDPADGAEFIALDAKLKWTAGFGAKLHYIVFGDSFDQVSSAAMGVPNGTTTYNPGPLGLAKTYYWRVDEFDGLQTHKGSVWSFATEGAVSGPNPPNGAVDIKPTPILSWNAGAVAGSHEVYFGTDTDAVRNATKTSPEYKGPKSLGDESYAPGQLNLSTTYFWRIDEVNNVNPDSPWAGNVWSFTTSDYFVIDDFEDYDAGAGQIWHSWHDGLGYGVQGTDPYFAGNGTGAAVGDETTPSYTEETIIHGGGQSMPLNYDNNKQGYAKYSEAEKTLNYTRDWTEEGVTELSLWFRGYPASVGSFVESPAGTFTMTASGADIWAVNSVEADEFHFAYKMLTGAGSIVARVNSVENTNGWAKAGVMIRESLNPDSAHAFACVTPSNGVASQGRPSIGGTSFNYNQTGIVAPYWVKLERSVSGLFTVSHSANGTSWQAVTGATPQNIPMGSNVYIGLALTAHDAAKTCQAVFSNVTTTGTVTGQWANQDIGILSNDAEPLYVAVSNSAGNPAIVVHDNPAAAQVDTWTEWIIPLQTFANQGIVLTNVDKIAIGLGTKGNVTAPGGSGKVYIDDIRLYRPRGAAE
jgi:hypothetical protein